MSYLQHYAMLLPVPGMIEENTIGLTHARIAAALRAMADKVEAGKEPIEEILVLGRDGPLSSEREDRWVWRDAERPNFLCKAAGGWVEATSTLIDLADTVTGAEAARLMALSTPAQRSNFVWCRPEDIGGIALVAEFRDDRTDVSFGADMREFLAKGDENLVESLARSGWDEIQAFDVIDALAEENDPAAIAMRNHLDQAQDHPDDRFPPLRIAFKDPQAATAFLKEVRPDLHDAIFSQAAPEI